MGDHAQPLGGPKGMIDFRTTIFPRKGWISILTKSPSLDHSHHQHKLPLRPPNAGLLSQESQLQVPARSSVHRLLPRRRPRRPRCTGDPEKAHPLSPPLRLKGLHQRRAVLRLLEQIDPLLAGRV